MTDKIEKILSRLPSWLLSLVTTAIILWLTLSPRPFGSVHIPLFPGSDKIAHGLMFGFLVWMICLDKMRKSDFKKVSCFFVLTASSISSLFGIVIEYLQGALPIGRSFEALDMAADTGGAFLAGVAWIFLQPKFPFRK